MKIAPLVALAAVSISSSAWAESPDAGAAEASGKVAPKAAPEPCTALGAVARDYQLGFAHIPRILKAGDVLQAQVRPALTGNISTICLDSKTVALPSDSARDGAGAVSFSVVVPSPGSGDSWQVGEHTLRIALATNPPQVITQVLRGRPALRSVAALPIDGANKDFRVVFVGDDFDADAPTNNSLRMGNSPEELSIIRDVCWTDADCNSRPVGLRGQVLSPQQIVISGIDPSSERKSTFEICVAGSCSDAVADSAAGNLFLVPLIALLLAVMVSLLVVALARCCLRAISIGRGEYLVRALFLDKETNTYSLSKLQFYLWTFAGLFGYIDLFIARNFCQHFAGLPAVPAGLPGIIGIAAGTAVGATVVTGINGPKGAGQAQPSLSDFVSSGEVVTAERVQFFVWSVVGAFGFCVLVAMLDPRTLVDLPEIPWSVLSISGISSMGYLGGKLARRPGPVLCEVVVKTGLDPAAPTVAPTPAGAAGAAATAPKTFGLIDLRGRTLSPDASIRVSVADAPGPDDIKVVFDALVPNPTDTAAVRKARVVEPDGADLAKRLLLVCDTSRLDFKTVFQTGTKHTLTIVNPDSQEASLPFTAS